MLETSLLTWYLPGCLVFDRGRKYCLYCSNVAGAFDRVRIKRLVAKLKACGVPEQWLTLFSSWLREREAKVIVGGVCSKTLLLRDMVFQGTAWWPPFWNTFYEDARKPVQDADFREVYADDLNAYKEFPTTVKNEAVLQEGYNCQKKLHR